MNNRHIKYKAVLPLLILALAGCSSSDSDLAAFEPPTPDAKTDAVVSSSGSTIIVKGNDLYSLEISGDGNTITIAEFNNIDTLDLSGSNNLVTFEGTNTVNSFNVSGNDNSVFADDGVTSSVSFTSDTGSGNSLTLQ